MPKRHVPSTKSSSPEVSVAAVKNSNTVFVASSAVPPAAKTPELTGALNSMSTTQVGESMPVATGGMDVVRAIHMPPIQLPINMAQIAVGIPALRSPANISAANETMLAVTRIDARKPATASLAQFRENERSRYKAAESG